MGSDETKGHKGQCKTRFKSHTSISSRGRAGPEGSTGSSRGRRAGSVPGEEGLEVVRSKLHKNSFTTRINTNSPHFFPDISDASYKRDLHQNDGLRHTPSGYTAMDNPLLVDTPPDARPPHNQLNSNTSKPLPPAIEYSKNSCNFYPNFITLYSYPERK